MGKELRFDKETIKKHKQFIKQWVLGLLEYDLTNDLEFINIEMNSKDLISCDDKVDYKWLDDNFEKMCIDISCDDKHKLYEIEINVKEI